MLHSSAGPSHIAAAIALTMTLSLPANGFAQEPQQDTQDGNRFRLSLSARLVPLDI